MPKCLNSKTGTYKGTEPSPKGIGYCARGEKIGTKMIGSDKNMWIVKQYNKSNKWVKYNENSVNKAKLVEKPVAKPKKSVVKPVTKPVVKPKKSAVKPKKK